MCESMPDKSDMDLKKWEMKKMLKKLSNYESNNSTSMVSLFIPKDYDIWLVSKKINDELGTASNIKSRENRQSVISALKSIQFHLKLFKEAPANGLVIYCGEIYCQEINREKKIMISFEPLKPLSYSLYVCDKRFHTEKIIDLFNSDEKKFGFIIIDGKGVLIARYSRRKKS